MSYAKAEACFYEAMRINKGGSSEWSVLKEGNALIDTKKTEMNYELITHHNAFNPSDYSKHHRGKGIAEYHKKVTGRSARMKGDDKQKSKAVGAIISLPRDYLKIDYGLTDEEYIAIAQQIESGKKDESKSQHYINAIKKMTQYNYNEDELELIKEFFDAALTQWQKNAGIRDEDMLYAVVHLDESWPHLHICALPTVAKEVVNKETGEKEVKYTYSTEKFNNHRTHYFDTMHTNIIEGMWEEHGIDASGLINGRTKDKAFTPGELSRRQREEGVELVRINHVLSKRNHDIENKINETEEMLEKRSAEIIGIEAKKEALRGELDELQGEILDEKQNRKLAENKGIKGLIKGATVNVEVSYDMAQSIKKSLLTKEKLEEREHSISNYEKRLNKKAHNLDAEIEKRVDAKLPDEIKEYRDVIIPANNALQQTLREEEERLRKKKEEQIQKEKELQDQTNRLEQQKQEVMDMQRHIEEEIETRVKKKLSQILREKLEQLFDVIKNRIYRFFKGEHQRALYDKILNVNLPEVFIEDGKDYGGLTIRKAMEKAELRDIRDMLNAQGVDYADIDIDDIRKIRSALSKGASIDEVIARIANEIDLDLDG